MMKRIPRLALLAFAAALLLSACRTSGLAREGDAPQNVEEELLEQHLDALGGQAALASITSLKWEGSAFIPSAGWTLPVTVYQARPHRVRTEVKIEEMGGIEIVSAYDGETAWTINPMMTRRPQKLTGLQADGLRAQADLDGLLVGASRQGKTVTYQGEEEVRGRPAHRLLVTDADSSVVHIWLDADTYLVAKTEMRGINPMEGGAVDVETYLDDYRDVSGMRMPFAIEVVMGGQTMQRVTLSDVDVNPDLSSDLFAFPAESP